MSRESINRIGANPNATYRVANLSSLLTVCAMALDSAEGFNEDIRKRATQDIKHVLEWGALYADDTLNEVEIAVAAGEKRT